MATITAPTQSESSPISDGDGGWFLRSDSRPGAFYHVRPDSCTCPDQTFRSLVHPDHRCKHLRRLFPRLCAYCGTETVGTPGATCQGCIDLQRGATHLCRTCACVLSDDATVEYCMAHLPAGTDLLGGYTLSEFAEPSYLRCRRAA